MVTITIPVRCGHVHTMPRAEFLALTPQTREETRMDCGHHLNHTDLLRVLYPFQPEEQDVEDQQVHLTCWHHVPTPIEVEDPPYISEAWLTRLWDARMLQYGLVPDPEQGMTTEFNEVNAHRTLKLFYHDDHVSGGGYLSQFYADDGGWVRRIELYVWANVSLRDGTGLPSRTMSQVYDEQRGVWSDWETEYD
jgi:hypothetical protein